MNKNNQTPAEWLQYLAAMALKHPERFEKMILVYEAAVYKETLQSFSIAPHQRSFGLKTNGEIISFLETAKLYTFMYMNRNIDDKL